jgi:nucleoside-diphosphate-sugar epimerase
MRIVVTGAAGFIGSNLCEGLADQGHQVTGIDCFSDYYSPRLKELNAQKVRGKGVEILRADLATDDLRAPLEEAEVVYHLAAQPGISTATPFEAYVRNNITATHRLLHTLMGSSALRCFINVSSSSVYGSHATDSETTPPKPTSFYGVTKLSAEQLALAYCRNWGLPACSLRLFSVYGPRERPDKLYTRLIRSILGNSEFPLFEGSEKHSRSFTFVGDVVEAFIGLPSQLDVCVGEIFNIGTEVEVTTGEGIEIVERILGRKARKVLRPRRHGDQVRTHANIDKSRRILGYDPRTSLEEGLRKQAEWFKEEVFGKLDP